MRTPAYRALISLRWSGLGLGVALAAACDDSATPPNDAAVADVTDVAVTDVSDVSVADVSDVSVADVSDVSVADVSDVSVADVSDVSVTDVSDVSVADVSDVAVTDASDAGDASAVCTVACLGGRRCVAGRCVDAWRSLSATNSPTPRSNHSFVWTGTELIVWGGYVPGMNFGESIQTCFRKYADFTGCASRPWHCSRWCRSSGSSGSRTT